MKFSLLSAFVAALAMTAIIATVSVGATKKAHRVAPNNQVANMAVAGPPPTMAEVFARRQAEKTSRQAALATELGITAKQLSEAIEAVKSDKLDADVAANKLTAAQRTAIIACNGAELICDRSNLPAGRPGQEGPQGGARGHQGGARGHQGGARGHQGGARGHQVGLEGISGALASKLNIPEATVLAALKKLRPAAGGPQGSPQGGPQDVPQPDKIN